MLVLLTMQAHRLAYDERHVPVKIGCLNWSDDWLRLRQNKAAFLALLITPRPLRSLFAVQMGAFRTKSMEKSSSFHALPFLAHDFRASFGPLHVEDDSEAVSLTQPDIWMNSNEVSNIYLAHLTRRC